MNLTPLLNPSLLVQAEEETLNEETIVQSSPATVKKRKKTQTLVHEAVFHMPYILNHLNIKTHLHSLVSVVNTAQQTFPVVFCLIYPHHTHVSKKSHELLLE